MRADRFKLSIGLKRRDELRHRSHRDRTRSDKSRLRCVLLNVHPQKQPLEARYSSKPKTSFRSGWLGVAALSKQPIELGRRRRRLDSRKTQPTIRGQAELSDNGCLSAIACEAIRTSGLTRGWPSAVLIVSSPERCIASWASVCSAQPWNKIRNPPEQNVERPDAPMPRAIRLDIARPDQCDGRKQETQWHN
jgi:hypothetical protein